jgi:NADPH2:quinone reductase
VRANHVLVKNYSVVGVHFGLYSRKMPEIPPQVHDEVVRLYMDGRIDPLVGEVVPMGEAPRALTALGNRATVGKVVVRVVEELDS